LVYDIPKKFDTVKLSKLNHLTYNLLQHYLGKYQKWFQTVFDNN